MSSLNSTDAYKPGHYSMFPKDMEYLQSNFTPRSSRVDGVKKVVFFGLQAFIKKVLMKEFNETFFDVPVEYAVTRHEKRMSGIIGRPFNGDHFRELHKLGYLPLKFCALKEGTECPLRIPMFTVENTVKYYGWLVNYIETVLSNTIWLPMTSATTALRFRRMLDGYANETSDTPEFVDWQGHDFSCRGHSSKESAAASGAGHLLAFAGSDTLEGMDFADLYYGDNGVSVKFVGGSVLATEHSVMCAGGKDDELETFRRLLKENPVGVLSVVSDTWDLWKVITKILPQLKDEIMARDGKLVIRPDSGDPVEILCGKQNVDNVTSPAARSYLTPEQKGVVELLYEIFPGPTNSKGYQTLDSHIGTIYGDSINYDRGQQICERLKAKKFATTIPVLGIGSYTYQYVTRDTFGFAMKATWCQVAGESRNLFKDPITDNGIKKSAKGRLAVLWKDILSNLENGEQLIQAELTLINEATPEQEVKSELKEIWRDGKFTTPELTFREVAERVGVRKILPE